MLTAICYCVCAVDSKDHLEKLMLDEINETRFTELPAVVNEGSGDNMTILPIHG